MAVSDHTVCMAADHQRDLNFDPPPGGGSGGPSIDAGPTDWLELVNGLALINAGVQKDRISLFTDIVFISMESDKDRVAIGAGRRADSGRCRSESQYRKPTSTA